MPRSTVLNPAGPGSPGLTAARARRLRPPSWRDPRLLVGVLLVLGSVVAGASVLGSADHTVPVLAATRTLTPGEVLGTQDVEAVQVRLDGRESRYLSAAGALPSDRVVLRVVSAGDLVAASSVGARGQVTLRPVSVPLDAQDAAELTPGTLVDIWVAGRRPDRSDGYAAPHQVAAGAQVASRVTRHSALGTSTTDAVRLLLGPDLVPALIEAVDNQARITLVPVPATTSSSGS